MRPETLYIHIPFCIKRCDYCDFPSSVYSESVADAYIVSLLSELNERAAHLSPSTIYIGGGTPTALSNNQLLMLLDSLNNTLDMSNVSEFSIEINPRTITTDKAMILRENNINRVSIGAQTFNEEGLKILGRAHSTKHISSTVSICREAGLENISLDLINSWPAQTVDNWLEDLEKTVALRPKHISSYCLMYEEGTPLFRKREKGILKVLGEDTEREMFDITGAFLGQNGFERYEISNFSLPGFECKHNISYWEGEEYIGLGVGAHSYVEGVRSSNTSDIASYIRMIAESGVAKNWQEKLIPEHSAREKMIIALRMSKGIDIKKFESDTGFEIYDLFGRDIKALLNDGWLISEKGRIFLSEKALPVSDSILMELIA